MEISKGIQIIDLALYLKKQKILIIADIHIGFEEYLNKQGILVPRFQFKEIIKKLKTILSKTNPKTIIINGDLKHEFGTISEQEWRDTLKLLDFLTKKANIILIKGNHDTILGPIAEKRNVEITDHYFTDNIYITHGHNIPKNTNFKKSETIIIGHTHPAISIKEKAKSEKFKCFMKGKYKEKQLIVMPSLNPITKGSSNYYASPFIKNTDDFEVYIIEDKVYYFGKFRHSFFLSNPTLL